MAQENVFSEIWTETNPVQPMVIIQNLSEYISGADVFMCVKVCWLCFLSS